MSNPGISVNTLHRYAKYSGQMCNMLHLVTVTWVHTNMPTKTAEYMKVVINKVGKSDNPELPELRKEIIRLEK